MISRDEFFNGYLDAILFTESADEGDTSLLSYGCGRANFSPDTLVKLRVECDDFVAANAEDLDAYCAKRGDPVTCAPDSFGRSSYSASECAGSDFWLSRNGHGAGFFDRGNARVFGRLQDAARVYGGVYVDFDGEIIHAN